MIVDADGAVLRRAVWILWMLDDEVEVNEALWMLPAGGGGEVERCFTSSTTAG